MRCPTLDQLPPPPPDKIGWPWTEDSPQLPDAAGDGRAWPCVSVVTPSYNQGSFIEETIRSVLLQGYPNLEYIIIDGGSTDQTLDIIRRYEPWLASWVSEADRGQTHAINKGWGCATGDILAYLNTDDCYLSGAIATAAQEFYARSDVGMVYGSAVIVDETEQEVRTWEAKPFDLSAMFAEGSVVPQPATFFSRTALKTVGNLNEQWHMIMDYELCIRIGMQLPTLCLHKRLARFRDHAGSKSRLRFQTMVSEVIQLLTTLSPDQIPPLKWWTIRNATRGRLHYELAVYYLSQGPLEQSKALRHLLTSIVFQPSIAQRQPRLTYYLAKNGLVGYFNVVREQVTTLVKRISE